MNPLTVCSVGAFTILNFVDARLERTRLNSVDLHRTLNKVDKTFALFKLILIAITTVYLHHFLSPTVTGKNPFGSEIVIGFGVFSLFLLPCNYLCGKINKFIHPYFHPSTKEFDEISKKSGITIGWGGSKQKDARQKLALAQLILNIALAILSPFNALFALNAAVKAYSYIKTSRQRDLKITFEKDISKVPLNTSAPGESFYIEPPSTTSSNSPRLLRRRGTDGPQKLSVDYFLTCIYPPPKEDDTCAICIDDKPDTRYCDNGHNYHHDCLAAFMASEVENITSRISLQRNVIQVTTDRGYKQPNKDYVKYDATLSKNQLTHCPQCRETSSFTSIEAHVQDRFNGKTSYVPTKTTIRK